MSVKLLTEHHLEFQSLKGCCASLSKSSKSTLDNMPHCWKSHVASHITLGLHTRNQSLFSFNKSFKASTQLQRQAIINWLLHSGLIQQTLDGPLFILRAQRP